jgi:hypothetical protein
MLGVGKVHTYNVQSDRVLVDNSRKTLKGPIVGPHSWATIMIVSNGVLLLSLSSLGYIKTSRLRSVRPLLFLFKLASPQFMVRSDTKRRTFSFLPKPPKYLFNSSSPLGNVPSSYVSDCLAALGPQ